MVLSLCIINKDSLINNSSLIFESMFLNLHIASEKVTRDSNDQDEYEY